MLLPSMSQWEWCSVRAWFLSAKPRGYAGAEVHCYRWCVVRYWTSLKSFDDVIIFIISLWSLQLLTSSEVLHPSEGGGFMRGGRDNRRAGSASKDSDAISCVFNQGGVKWRATFVPQVCISKSEFCFKMMSFAFKMINSYCSGRIIWQRGFQWTRNVIFTSLSVWRDTTKGSSSQVWIQNDEFLYSKRLILYL